MLTGYLTSSGKDYIYMNSSVCRNGTSFVESLFEKFGECDLPHDTVKPTSIENVYRAVSRLYTSMHMFEFYVCVGFFQDCELGGLKDITDDLKEDQKNSDDILKEASEKYCTCTAAGLLRFQI